MSRVPLATYRLQLHAAFGFDAAAEVANYLHELGVSHAYSSPYLQAAPGSQHGYDVVDHQKVNEELGGGEAHARFCKRLGEVGLGQVLDIVPNHMAISGRRNRYWWDVLENGPASRYASYFDVDWQSQEEKLRNKMLMPVLGDHYGRVLNRGELRIERSRGDFYVRYFDNEYPVAPRSLASVLTMAAKECGSDYLAFLADSLCRLPAATATARESLIERHRDKEVVHNLLERLCEEVPFIAQGIDSVLAKLNGSPNALDEVLEKQHYRLAYWRTAEQELGYRRFFDVNTLIGLRMEDPQVFADTHGLILNWLREGVLDGVRIDHPDGLRDPRQYFDRLRRAAPQAWILGEKILEPGETLRSGWCIDGTTGYDFLNELGGLFVDSREEEAFTRVYTEFTRETVDYEAVCREKKHVVLRDLLGSDVNRLTSLFVKICEGNRDRRDYTRHDIRHALRELAACFPIYRTYVIPERDEREPDDERYLAAALEAAKRNRPDLDSELFDFLADVLMLRVQGSSESEFVMRFQQFTAPVMAKGVEDTVFYCYNRLTSLNEVGGDPGRFGVSPDEFHQYCYDTQAQHPSAMLTTSTHDTKRSEDVRARISLLSEIPDRWKRALAKWSKLNEKARTGKFPDRNTEYFIYQSMLGAWPIGIDRLLPYIEKMAREGKQQTSWISPNEAFEAATKQFIESIYQDRLFLGDFESFVNPLIPFGWINSLSQVLLKLTAPGVPDLYQGTELWDLSLVDPDNRRPVDYTERRRLLAELPNLRVEDVWSRIEEGLPKLWTVYHALQTRRNHQLAFGTEGKYQPLRAAGAKAEHAVAFLRGDAVAVVVPRLVQKLNGLWGATTIDLPAGPWHNELTGLIYEKGSIQLRELLEPFPVALLVRQ